MGKLKFCPDLTQVIWEKAMMVGHGDFQRIRPDECIIEPPQIYWSKNRQLH